MKKISKYKIVLEIENCLQQLKLINSFDYLKEQ